MAYLTQDILGLNGNCPSGLPATSAEHAYSSHLNNHIEIPPSVGLEGQVVDIALGRQVGPKADLFKFAKEVKGSHFGNWKSLGLYSETAQTFPKKFSEALDTVIQRGGQIHFNLDDLKIRQALGGNPHVYVGRYTAWELQQITRNPFWFERTTFYARDIPLSAEQVKRLGIVAVK